jgi:hypothetical protein
MQQQNASLNKTIEMGGIWSFESITPTAWIRRYLSVFRTRCQTTSGLVRGVAMQEMRDADINASMK